MSNNKTHLQIELRKYCSACQSFDESEVNFKFALKLLELQNTDSVNDIVDEDEKKKFITFLQMAIIAYVRPFRNDNFKLSEDIAKPDPHSCHKFLVNYRNNIIAHHENLKQNNFIEDPGNYFCSQFNVLIDREMFVPGFAVVIPRAKDEIVTYYDHVIMVMNNLREKIDKFVKHYEIELRKFPCGLYEVEYNPDLLLRSRSEVRFNKTSGGKLVVVPKYL
jgi:hypothetical protein